MTPIPVGARMVCMNNTTLTLTRAQLELLQLALGEHIDNREDDLHDGGDHAAHLTNCRAVDVLIVTALESMRADDACPGCGCEPGDGLTDGCEHPEGCGYFREEGKA